MKERSRVKQLKELFQALDRNHSNDLDLEEVLSISSHFSGQKEFSSDREYLARCVKMEWLDANFDGKVSVGNGRRRCLLR